VGFYIEYPELPGGHFSGAEECKVKEKVKVI